jgi:hypothetical protein
MQEKQPVFRKQASVIQIGYAPADGLCLYCLGLPLKQAYTSTTNTTKSHSEYGSGHP